MKIFEAKVIQELDAFTIKNEPISSVDLMERASQSVVDRMKLMLEKSSSIAVFCGTGNNGGDGLAISRLLQELGFSVKVWVLQSGQESEGFNTNLARWETNNAVVVLEQEIHIPVLSQFDVVIDALFGSGLNRPIEEVAVALIKQINTSGCKKVAVDIPSGMYCDQINGKEDTVVKADKIYSFQLPKRSFFYEENALVMNSLEFLNIGLDQSFIDEQESNIFLTTEEDVNRILKPREKFAHKGTYGHALFVGGSYGKVGAAKLASEACMRAGVGLLTAFVPKCAYVILQSTVPECMLITSETVSTISSLPEIEAYQAIGVGPGLGIENDCLESLAILLISCQSPIVVDADALNLIALNPHLMVHLPGNSILTPHPKEFERLAGKTSNSQERIERASKFAQDHKVILVLKGAHTAVCLPNGEIHFNSTGNPGMATAGSGDVLTGVILSLLAQGYSPRESAILGVYKHGEAGDRAQDKLGYSALLARDIVSNLRID